jgi:hypothetical protein
MLRNVSCRAVSFAVVALFFLPVMASAQVAPPLGTAAAFGVLGHSAVTGAAGAGAVVSGEVGSSPTPAVTNFPPSSVSAPFTIHFANDGVVQQAHTDAIAAYNALLIQGTGTVIADNLAGQILTPGIYSFTVGAPDLPVGATLTLNDPGGAGIFIFNVASSLTANVTSALAGTANRCNIYWRVGTSATLNGVNFWGTVIADASITIGSASNLVGRALAGTGATGAVTIAGAGGNTIGGCSVAGAGVPTLSEWAMISLTLLLACAGFAAMRARRTASPA